MLCHKNSSPSQTFCSRRFAVVLSIHAVSLKYAFRGDGLRWMINILVSGAGEPFSRNRQVLLKEVMVDSPCYAFLLFLIAVSVFPL
jgi:hypothetical protein